MPPDQTPKLSLVGANNPAFIAQRPFMLDDAPKKGSSVAKKKKGSKKKHKK
jgi:hypothetical protein